jgi:hypothetical protein
MRNYNILTVDSDSLDFQFTERLWAGQTLYELYKGCSGLTNLDTKIAL